MERNAIIKLCVAAGLIVVAVVLFIVGNAEEPVSDDTTAAWYCTTCHRGFELTGEQMRAQVSRTRGGISSDAEDADDAEGIPKARSSGRGMIQVALCPYCNKWTGFAAQRCPKCGEIFQGRAEDGTLASCPHCAADPTVAP